MARKHPAAAPNAGNSVPDWVWNFHRVDWWDGTEQPPLSEVEHWHKSAGMNYHVTAEGCLGTRRWCQARKRWGRASKKWCAERGYSFTMTVQGWRRPSPSEQVTGHTDCPWPDGRPPHRNPPSPEPSWSLAPTPASNSDRPRSTKASPLNSLGEASPRYGFGNAVDAVRRTAAD